MEKDNILSESTNNRKLVEKIAQEIIDATTLTGVLLTFYPPIVGKNEQIPPIRAVIDSDWIHDDKSVGVESLTQDIRKMGRQYIRRILGFGITQGHDPIYKEVNDIVIDNILGRARNHDWDKEMQQLKDLKDKHGTVGFLQDLNESTEDVYGKIANRAVKESRLIKSNGKLFLKSPAFESGVNVETVLNIMSGRAKRSIPNTFIKYMKEIYNIEKKGYNTVIYTIWGLYRDKIIEMILEADPDLIPYYKKATYLNLNESKEDKSKNYREKVYRDLVKKTKWRDDSYREIDVDGVCNKINSYIEWGSSGAYFYVIPPCIEDLLTNVYGLTYSEMDRFFWDWYGEHIIYMLISKKEYLPPHIKRLNLSYLNESKEDKQKEYLTKVVDSIVKNSIVDRRSDVAFHKKGMIFFPWFNFPLSIEDDLKSFFESSLPHKQRPNFAQYCRDNFGLTNEEIKIVLDELELIIKDEIEDVLKLPMSKWNRLYESKDARQGEFLNYVLEDLMNNTTWKDASYTILLLHGQNISTSINYDTFTIDWIPGKVDEMFTNMGLDSREKRMIWEIYKEFVLDKMISEGNNTWRKKHLHMRRYPYLNESVDSVDKNKPYLDKVVDKLKHYTTFIKQTAFNGWTNFYTAKVPFTGGQKWYIEWFSGSLETGYGFKDGFKKEMRDVYGLTPEEIEYVYMKFTSYLIKEFKDRQTKVHVVKD